MLFNKLLFNMYNTDSGVIPQQEVDGNLQLGVCQV